MPACIVCGQKFGLIELRNSKCKSCRDDEAARVEAEEIDRQRRLVDRGITKDVSLGVVNERAKSVILTTGPTIPGVETASIVQIVAAEVALGMNILKDIANNWRDTFGGRSASVQNTLKDAREACLLELKREAFLAGADAVIAVRLDYSEISTGGGSGGGILFVAASGTAVKLKSA